jgi:hypothetical protein
MNAGRTGVAGRRCLTYAAFSAGVAQLVEQRIRNARVVGSSPISGNLFKHLDAAC